MDEVQRKFRLESWTVGALPIVNHFLERLRVPQLLETYLEAPDPRCTILPKKVLLLLIRYLIVDRHPLYGLSQWTRSMLPELVEFEPEEIEQLNDDRIGRALDRLFDADRLALLTPPPRSPCRAPSHGRPIHTGSGSSPRWGPVGRQ